MSSFAPNVKITWNHTRAGKRREAQPERNGAWNRVSTDLHAFALAKESFALGHELRLVPSNEGEVLHGSLQNGGLDRARREHVWSSIGLRDYLHVL